MEDVKDIERTIDADTSTTPAPEVGTPYLVTRNGITLRWAGLTEGTQTGVSVVPYRTRYRNSAATLPPGAGINTTGTTILSDYMSYVRIFSVVQPGSTYNVTLMGISVNYTAAPGSTDQSVANALKALMDATAYPVSPTITTALFYGYWTVFVRTTGTTSPPLTVSLTAAGSWKSTVGYRVSVNGGSYSISLVINFGYDYPTFLPLVDPLNFYDMILMPAQPGFVINTIKAFTYDPAFPTYVDGTATAGAPATYSVDNVPSDPGTLGPNDVYFDGNQMHYGTPFILGTPEVIRYLYK